MNDDGTAALIGDPLILRTVAAAPTFDIAELYAAHRSRLTNLAAAITLDRALAEEVVQEAFIGLQRRAAGVTNPEGYLQRSVVNNAISVLRKRRRAALQPIPIAKVFVSPEIDEAWHAVSRLPPRERSVVVLRYWLDHSEADIAESLGWPRGTVKSTLHRALKRLREEITP